MKILFFPKPKGGDADIISSQILRVMEDKKMNKFTVHIADKTGHSVVQMTQQEVVDKVSADTTTWLYVNDTSVSVDDFASMQLEEDSLIRLMPPIIGGSEESVTEFKVKIPSSAGHSTVLMSKETLVERATQEQGKSWPFVNGQMLSLEQLVAEDLKEEDDIILMPQMVGGVIDY